MWHSCQLHLIRYSSYSYSWQSSASFTENVFGYSPGQGLTLHMMTSTAFPSQGLPPCWAGGSLQVRTLVLLPWPQVREHSSQRDHSDQLPSTVEGQRYRYCYLICHLDTVSFTSTEGTGWILCVWFFKSTLTWTGLSLTTSCLCVRSCTVAPSIGG